MTNVGGHRLESLELLRRFEDGYLHGYVRGDVGHLLLFAVDNCCPGLVQLSDAVLPDCFDGHGLGSSDVRFG